MQVSKKFCGMRVALFGRNYADFPTSFRSFHEKILKNEMDDFEVKYAPNIS